MRRPLLILILLVLATHVAAQAPADRLRNAIESARSTAAAEEKSNPSWKDFGPDATSLLDSADKQLTAGRLHYVLDQLTRAQVLLSAGHSQGRAAAEGMAGFQAAWKKAEWEIDAPRKTVRDSSSPAPALVRAIVESARLKSRTLIHTSKAYAEVTGPAAGFYYLGEGEGNAGIARTASSYALAVTGAAWNARSIAPELVALQSRVNDSFKPPIAQEKHSTFIRVSAALKFAEELDAAGLYSAATLQYLDALQMFTSLISTGQPQPEAQKLRAALAEASDRLRHSGQDASLALLFVEKGEAFLSDPAPDEPHVRGAAAVVSAVLPTYDALLQRPVAASQKQARVIDVTLVRWPYT